MSDKNKKESAGVGEEIEVAISRTEAFIEKNQKQLIYAVLAVVVVVAGFILFNKFYKGPKEVESQIQMSKSQQYFAMDSFQLALDGDGIDSKGFVKIINNYGITESANLANAYAGICYYKLGEYQKAIDYLSDFDGNDEINISTSVTGLIGDTYVELEEYDKALSYFTKAYETENKVLSPIYMKKAALVYESKGEYEDAIELYTEIKNKYFDSNIARDIEKYIERASMAK